MELPKFDQLSANRRSCPLGVEQHPPEVVAVWGGLGGAGKGPGRAYFYRRGGFWNGLVVSGGKLLRQAPLPFTVLLLKAFLKV